MTALLLQCNEAQPSFMCFSAKANPGNFAVRAISLEAEEHTGGGLAGGRDPSWKSSQDTRLSHGYLAQGLAAEGVWFSWADAVENLAPQHHHSVCTALLIERIIQHF
jgi:hypothetical protein